MRTVFSLLIFIAAPALAQPPDARTPEQMMVEAYGRLMNSSAQGDTGFWAPERWYAPSMVSWIKRYESCHHLSPGIWHANQGQPKLTNVDITPVPPIGDEAQVIVSLRNRDRPEQRIFFFRRDGGFWQITNVMASGGLSLNTSRQPC